MSSSSTVTADGSSSSSVPQPSETEAEVETVDIELDGGEGDEDAEGGEDEDDADDAEDQSSDSISSDEIDALLDEGLPEDYRREAKPKEYTQKEIIVLEEKGKNTIEVLPGGWIEVRHCSGMPLYLHRKTRVCCLSKPYNLGPASARRHPVPLSAIPCLAYAKALQREKDQVQAAALPQEPKLEPDGQSKSGESVQDRVWQSSVTGREAEEDAQNPLCKRMRYDKSPGTGTTTGKALLLPRAKVETARENTTLNSLEPLALREYCQKLFKFKQVTIKRFGSWSARRKHNKKQKRIKLQRPTLPEGVKLITFPIYNSSEGEGGRPGKEYVMNPQGKSSVCILHEYVQHALRLQPTYAFKELENAATPYAATVIIKSGTRELQYGTGFGSSKKQAKAEAAKQTLEILIPAMKDQLDGPNANKKKDVDHTVYFDQMELDDPRITGMCQNMSEPSPYTLLLTCVQRNFGKEENTNVDFQMLSSNNQTNKFRMKVMNFSVDVTATNKKEGKQLASQAVLAQIHPHIKNFGSFLRLYGNNSIKSVKEKKQEEQQITTLQSKASANSPNYAILAKLREEMRKLLPQPPASASTTADSATATPTTATVEVKTEPSKSQ